MRSSDSVGSRWQAPFFTIWTGQQLSLVGSRIAQFALVWWLTDMTGSATVLATASIAALLPEILLGPVAGAYVDRWNRRIVMMVADGLIALASLWLAYLFWADAMRIWHIYVIMMVRAVGGSFHWPAMQASTSLMVPKKHLTRVAGLNQTMYGVLSVAGPPLGALALGLLPAYGVMLTDVGTALLAIVPLSFVSVPQPQRSDGGATSLPSIWEDIREGLRYIGAWPGLIALIGLALVVKLALTPAFSLIPLLVRDHFSGDAARLSLFQSVAGVGMLAGGLLLSAWGGSDRRIYTTLGAVAVMGVGFVVLGFLPTWLFSVALFSIFVVGFTMPLVDGPIMAILQGTVPPEVQGRVFTMMVSLLSLTAPVGLAVAGPMSDWLGLRVWYLGAGFVALVAGATGFFVPVLVHVEDNHGRGGLAVEDGPAISASVVAMHGGD